MQKKQNHFNLGPCSDAKNRVSAWNTRVGESGKNLGKTQHIQDRKQRRLILISLIKGDFVDWT
jgi:hypothetical protein